MYDFIGDIHGYADELKALLEKLSYRLVDGVYRHSTRKAFFMGDLIDRGPKIRETLQIVKAMIDNDQALTIMGNHEYNAICYNIKDAAGNYLREHSAKNVKQHTETWIQFEDYRSEYYEYIEWFRTLPLCHEAEKFRVVHACWDARHIETIDEKLKSKSFKKNASLTDEFFKVTSDKSEPFHRVIEETLKGKELRLPAGKFFTDKEGHQRKEIRIKWWLNPVAQQWQDLSIHYDPMLPEGLVDESFTSAEYYVGTEKPVFFGHYWYQGQPQLLRKNICCLDYSVAKQGKLVAYRFNGEKLLNNDNFIFVRFVAAGSAKENLLP